ncbi:MAG: DUF1592 domain-containing protein [Pseudomonadales bacterium]|nr:DUF1592 domain-containing protein [Pseudomonadales bacterium]
MNGLFQQTVSEILEMVNTEMVKKILAASICSITVMGLGMHPGMAADDSHDFEALQRAGQEWGFLDQYCSECHNFDDYSGGIDFTSLNPDDLPENADIFEKAVRKLRGGMMPPPGQEKPAEERRDEFVAWLESYLDEAGSVTLEPHRIALHRLNRKEYVNAIRDLVGLEINPAAVLPEDNTSEGFDNVADALQISPSFIDQYVSAARTIMEQAVGDPAPSLSSTTYTPREAGPTRAEGGSSQQFHIEGLPLGTRGGLLAEHWFPADGEYSISIGDLAQALWVYNMEFKNTLIVTVDGEKIFQVNIGGEQDMKSIDVDQDPSVDAINARLKNIPFTTTAGPHKVGVTFVRRTFAESDDRLQHFIPGSVQDRILSINSFEIRGPYNPAGLQSSPSRDKIFSCYPKATAEEKACAEKIITAFASRAYRRPVTAQDTDILLDFYEAGYETGGFDEGIRQSLTRVLSSPNFLYRAETAPPDMKPGSIYQLGGEEMASRLSFFLWSSLPDQELLDLAAADKLKDPEILEEQVLRMLADPRSRTLASNFAYQWLGLANLDDINPDRGIFPYASGAGDLRADFKKEVELFVDSVFRENRSVIDLLDANYSYLNERLALHYGINTVKGNRFRRVELEDSRRWGLLGKGGVLMVSSYPNRTSSVRRGAWVMERLMGTPPSAPPPNVEALVENVEGKPASTVRERMEQHRQNPSCNACHAVLDPLGFALENFDAVGRWRERDRFTGTEIDASGELPNGDPINGPADLRKALLARPDMLAQTLTEKLMIYALGRTIETSDMPIVRAIVREAAKDDYRFSSLVMNIVRSRPFQTRVVPETANVNGQNGVALND